MSVETPSKTAGALAPVLNLARRAFPHSLRLGAVAAAAVVTLGLSAVSAQAFTRSNVSGYTGAFYSLYTPQIEGGICDAPTERVRCNDGGMGTLDQIFINGYKVYSDAYSTSQVISSYAYLYYWNGSSWVLNGTRSMGSCTNVAGGGQGYCAFGGPAPDQIGNNCTVNTSYCRPAWYNMAAGYHWTAVIRVYWGDRNTGQTLGQADYWPSGSADIGCAGWAVKQSRCAYGTYQGNSVIWLG